jgi:hypothetical protein
MAVTGFHTLDGARFLAAARVSPRLVGLVAHHSCAVLEAELRGMSAELAEFDDEPGTIRDALWYCDITTSPDGEPAAATERIAEIERRYGPDHLVTRPAVTLAVLVMAARCKEARQALCTSGGRRTLIPPGAFPLFRGFLWSGTGSNCRPSADRENQVPVAGMV